MRIDLAFDAQIDMPNSVRFPVCPNGTFQFVSPTARKWVTIQMSRGTAGSSMLDQDFGHVVVHVSRCLDTPGRFQQCWSVLHFDVSVPTLRLLVPHIPVAV